MCSVETNDAMEVNADEGSNVSQFTFKDVENAFLEIVKLHTLPFTGNNVDGEVINIFKSTKNNNQNRNNVRDFFPSRVTVGEKLFSSIPSKHVVEFFIVALASIPQFKAFHPELMFWNMRNEVGIEHIFIQNHGKGNNRRKENRINMVAGNEETSKNDARTSNDLKVSDISAINAERKENEKPTFTNEQRQKIIELLVPIYFSPSQKLWNLAISAMCMSNKYHKMFADIVMRAAASGVVSYMSLEYCLATPSIAKYFTSPNYVAQCLLIGPLRGAVVESFASNRAQSFRDEVKHLLLELERCKNNEQKFRDAVVRYANCSYDRPFIPKFSQFISNVFNLMRFLRRDYPINGPIAPSWAHTSIKRAAKRVYVEHTWHKEQLEDLLHSVIVQRPSMRSFVVNMLKNDYQDVAAAHRWQKFNPHVMSRTRMSTNFEKIDYYQVVEGWLSIPNHVQIYFVDTANKLIFVENELSSCEESDFPVVGLDSEWSPYVMQSRASIIQLAFEKSVYLLDLDALRLNKRMSAFLDRLFNSEKVLKIGFQFGEDLVQLRECIRSCLSLYNPQNLICAGKLITQLLVQSKLKNFDINAFFPPLDRECGAVEASMDDSTLATVDVSGNSLEEGNGSANSCLMNDSINSAVVDLSLDETGNSSTGALVVDDVNNNENEVMEDNCVNDGTNAAAAVKEVKVEDIKNIGLSAICQRMLGLALEKSEQCSVWDRRPLRDRQIRYAALDAYCMLMLYRRCQEWAEVLGVEVHDLEAAQEKCHSSLPLFWSAE